MTTLQKADPIRDAFAEMQEELNEHEKDVLAHDILALGASAAAAAAAWDDPNEPMGWVVNWLPMRLWEIDLEHAALDRWVEREHKRIANKAEAAMYQWGQEADIQAGKRMKRGQKSLDTPAGPEDKPWRIGTRQVAASRKVVIDDDETALAHAAQRCPDAIKVTTTHKLLKDKLKELPEALPGTHVEESAPYTTFFVGPHKPKRRDAITEPPDVPRLTAAQWLNKETPEQVPLCETCGKNYAEPGITTCLGCQVYADHQAQGEAR